MSADALALSQIPSLLWSLPLVMRDDSEDLLASLERAVRRAVPPLLWEQVEDLVQQAHLRVLPRLEEGRELRPSYLYRVAHSVVMDALRHRRTHPEEPGEVTLIEGAADGAVGPERLALGEELRAALEACLELATPLRRRLLGLYLLGYTVPEAARLLALGRKKAENHIYRGLAELRACLRRRGVTP